MRELIAFDIFRTEPLNVDGEQYMVHFSKRRDGAEIKISAISEQHKNKSVSIHFLTEVASNFYATRAYPLSDEAVALLAVEVRSQYPRKV